MIGGAGFAHELRFLLEDLKTAKPEPREGVRLVASFFETDEAIFNSCNDSGGEIGPIFKYNAVELFSAFASRCADKTG